MDPEFRRSRERRGLSGVLAELGAPVQAAIPGLYAWVVTVAPAAWSRGAPLSAKVFAILALLALITAPLLESREVAPVRLGPVVLGRGDLARIWSVWGFVLSSATVWALVPQALGAARIDAVRGMLGILGWGFFAFASAGPALRSLGDLDRVSRGSPLKPRSSLPRGDGAFIGVGAAAALALGSLGWGVAVPERAVLVRLVAITCGIAVLATATSLALGRHSAGPRATLAMRGKRALPWLLLLVAVVAGGTLTLR